MHSGKADVLSGLAHIGAFDEQGIEFIGMPVIEADHEFASIRAQALE
ncbi:hypothetical protein ACVWWO_007394 [Bradyrhizobium sp. F1.13.1]